MQQHPNMHPVAGLIVLILVFGGLYMYSRSRVDEQYIKIPVSSSGNPFTISYVREPKALPLRLTIQHPTTREPVVFTFRREDGPVEKTFAMGKPGGCVSDASGAASETVVQLSVKWL